MCRVAKRIGLTVGLLMISLAACGSVRRGGQTRGCDRVSEARSDELVRELETKLPGAAVEYGCSASGGFFFEVFVHYKQAAPTDFDGIDFSVLRVSGLSRCFITERGWQVELWVSPSESTLSIGVSQGAHSLLSLAIPDDELLGSLKLSEQTGRPCPEVCIGKFVLLSCSMLSVESRVDRCVTTR